MGGSNSSEIGGVRVFKVIPGSPAAEAGLEIFFDFILEINGVKMDPNGQQGFAKVIQDAENGVAKLQVFNTRAHTTREVVVNPRKWAGTGLLGATVRYDVVDPAENHGIRVLEVFPNSPAAHAGLVAFQDFLLGTSQTVFHDIDELVEVVTSSINQRIQVYVYNADSETVREVAMAPNNDWGGDGCIGCDIGTGLLHRIPAPRRMPGGMAPMSVPVPVPPSAQFAYPPVQPGVLPPMPVPAVPQAVPPPAIPTGYAQVPGAYPVAAPTMPSGLPPGVPAGGSQPQAAAFPAMAPPTVPVPALVPQVPAQYLSVPVQAPTSVPVPAPAPLAVPGVPQVPVPPPCPSVPFTPSLPVPAVPTVATATTSQAEELAALQARIQALGAGASSTAPAPASQVAGMKWPPQPHQPQVAGVTWPPQPAPQELLAASPLPAGAPMLPMPSSPGGPDAGMAASPAGAAMSPVTPASGFELPRAPPCTPMNAEDAPRPVDLAGAMDPASFAGSPADAATPTPPGAGALL